MYMMLKLAKGLLCNPLFMTAHAAPVKKDLSTAAIRLASWV